MGKQLIISSSVTLIIASIIACTTWYFWGCVFGPVFIFSIIGQIILFYLVSVILEQFSANKTMRQLANEQTSKIEAAIKNQSVSVECAYCNTINLVPVVLSRENIFNCYQCQQENIIQLKYFAARITSPVVTKVELKEEHELPGTIKEKITEMEQGPS